MRRKCLPAVFLAVLCAAVPAAAAVVLRVGVDDLTDKATAIVVGKVKSVEARWTSDHTTIDTYVTIHVKKVLKGAVGRDVVVTCPGGKVGDDLLQVSGVPTFEKKERVLVFLWKNKNGDLLPLGLNQGKFHIERGKNGEPTASNSLEGLTFALRPGQSAASASTPDSMPLSDLEQKIEDRIVKTAGSTPSGSGGSTSTSPKSSSGSSSGSQSSSGGSSSTSSGSTSSSSSSGAGGSGTATPPSTGSTDSGTATPPSGGSKGSGTSSPPAGGPTDPGTPAPSGSGTSSGDTKTPQKSDTTGSSGSGGSSTTTPPKKKASATGN